jgi:hypothetical protein
MSKEVNDNIVIFHYVDNIVHEVVNDSTMLPKMLSFTPAPFPEKRMVCCTIGGYGSKKKLLSPISNIGSSEKTPQEARCSSPICSYCLKYVKYIFQLLYKFFSFINHLLLVIEVYEM